MVVVGEAHILSCPSSIFHHREFATQTTSQSRSHPRYVYGPGRVEYVRYSPPLVSSLKPDRTGTSPAWPRIVLALRTGVRVIGLSVTGRAGMGKSVGKRRGTSGRTRFELQRSFLARGVCVRCPFPSQHLFESDPPRCCRHGHPLTADHDRPCMSKGVRI